MSTCQCPSRPIPGERLGGKIQASHLARYAIVYVRQSTMQQVDRHQESTRLQYALVDRAVALGWSPAQVLVIDEDQGRSGSNAEGRPGFQRLVAEVGLNHVGLVLVGSSLVVLVGSGLAIMVLVGSGLAIKHPQCMVLVGSGLAIKHPGACGVMLVGSGLAIKHPQCTDA